MMTTNLPSGYHRDLQLLKEHLFPAFGEIHACIEMAILMLSRMEVKGDLLKDPKYLYLFSVEEVNRRVLAGSTFRDAYREVGLEIEKGEFQTNNRTLNHTHEGSIGNLCTSEIKARMDSVLARFPVEKVKESLQGLLHH
jgi:argininosuccinate lyase